MRKDHFSESRRSSKEINSLRARIPKERRDQHSSHSYMGGLHRHMYPRVSVRNYVSCETVIATSHGFPCDFASRLRVRLFKSTYRLIVSTTMVVASAISIA